VGVELGFDFGAVRCEAVLGPEAVDDLIDRLTDCRDRLDE
jgi:hypothetical protein